jgi:pimeloyl-ACP methyl ester carboxylesterase
VARLAADLRDFLTALQLQVSLHLLDACHLGTYVGPLPMLNACLHAQDVTVVGSSMGAAIIWAYIELFGEAGLRRAVFVDQVMLLA